MVGAIRGLDGEHRVTVGLHAPSLSEDNGLRADRMFADCDVAAMHAYPIYADFAAGPLDPDVVPFATALTAALAGQPALMEEFGACTAPAGAARQTWQWEALGKRWSQLMVSEEELADHLEEVLPRLVRVGASGALLWCFADYHESTWDRPPCDTKLHERFFGLVRPDGTLKPHAEVVRRFIAGGPRIAEPEPRARIKIDGDRFYSDPAAILPGLYEAFRREA